MIEVSYASLIIIVSSDANHYTIVLLPKECTWDGCGVLTQTN